MFTQKIEEINEQAFNSVGLALSGMGYPGLGELKYDQRKHQASLSVVGTAS